jgi:hypothetical protein
MVKTTMALGERLRTAARDEWATWLNMPRALTGIGSAETAAAITLNVSLMALFLTTFFFTFGVQVEHDVVRDDAQVLVDTLARDVPLLPQSVQASLRQSLEGLSTAPAQSPSAADAAVAKSNAVLMRQAFLVAGDACADGLLLVVLVFWLPTRRNVGASRATTRATTRGEKTDMRPGFGHAFSLWHVGGVGLVMIAIIAFVETTFAVTVLRNYRALDPNSAALAVVQELQVAAADCRTAGL